jgi:dienelactone hydrolase
MALLTGAAQAETLVSVSGRSCVEQKFLLATAEKPAAAVILFAGGHGALGLGGSADNPTIGRGASNFLVRTRKEFVRAGLTVALVDAPSDRQGSRGMLGGFRASAEHCQDIEAVVRYLRRQGAAAVWLIGASRGTESAANCAIRIRADVAGLVLTSPVTRGNLGGPPVTSLELGAIGVPTLVVVHELDECEYAPPSGGHEIMSKLTRVPKRELKIIRGGERPRGKPCEGLTAHGFLGVESQVIDAIASFIRAAPRGPNALPATALLYRDVRMSREGRSPKRPGVALPSAIPGGRCAGPGLAHPCASPRGPDALPATALLYRDVLMSREGRSPKRPGVALFSTIPR